MTKEIISNPYGYQNIYLNVFVDNSRVKRIAWRHKRYPSQEIRDLKEAQIEKNMNPTRNALQPYFEPVEEAIDSGEYQRIAVKTCHAVGKTFTLKRIVDTIMGSHKLREVNLILAAPTYQQVCYLWKDWSPAYRNKIELWINKGIPTQESSPRKRGKAANSETVVIFEEAPGVDPQFWNQAEDIFTSGSKILFIAIGTPGRRDSDFFTCFKIRLRGKHSTKFIANPLWKTFSINCFDSPNLKESGFHCMDDIEKEVEIINNLADEEALERFSSYPCPVPYLISARWVIERACDWGVEHPFFRAKALGEFPLAAPARQS